MLGDENFKEDVPARAKKPKFKIPSDFDNEAAFLEQMRKDFYDDVMADKLNREAMLEDLQFMVADQWTDAVRSVREAAGKPVLTVNRIPAFVAQIVGNRRLNETEIKVVPDNGGTVPVARVREGLIRSIQKISRADIAYDTALQNAAICGLGNFQITIDYDSDDVFEQTMKFEAIPDALAVVWDRMVFDPTGADAGHVFVVDSMPRQEFEKRWPWSTPADLMDPTIRGDIRMNGWISVDDVRVVTYHRVRTRRRTLALFDDGSTRDISDAITNGGLQDLLPNIVQRADGSPIVREAQRKYVESYLCSALDILEGPYELPISRVPVFRVPGWEVCVGEWKHRWGLVRFLKDPQRLHNYSRSMVAQRMMQTPQAKWLASADAVAGREKDFRNSARGDDPLLIYNGETGIKPEILPPSQIEQAWMGLAEITAQDLKDISNIHEANLGMPSNEVSGAAIMARQRVSDTGTVLYHDNLTQAIEQAGIVADQLIPYLYDTPRIIKVLGNDAKQDMQIINAMGDPRSIDITAGKYSVSVVSGPSYATKRMEALASMTSLANAAPQLLATFADYYVEAQDWPLADKIAKRIRMSMPPGILSQDEVTPEIAAKAQGQAQQQQMQQKMMIQQAIAEYMKTQSEVALNSARAKNFEVEAETAPARVQTEAMTAASQAAERELAGHLDAIKVAGGA